MSAEDLLLDVMSSTNDLGLFIAAWELMIEDPEYKGVRVGIQNQLDFLKYMNRNGCKTYEDLFNRLSDRAVDFKVVADFVKNNYNGRDNAIFDSIKEGYPEFFLNRYNLN